jgi:hypothetical protein
MINEKQKSEVRIQKKRESGKAACGLIMLTSDF